MGIRYRFCRLADLEQVVFELGQLAGAVQRGGVHHERRQNFGVAVLAGVQVEHEVGQRPLQLRAQLPVDSKTRARDLGGALQIQNSQRLSQIPVRLGREIELRRLAPAADFLVVRRRAAHGHARVRHVGNPDQQPAQLAVELLRNFFMLLDLLAQALGFFDQPRRILLVLLELRDLFRGAVALGLQVLGFGDGFAPARVEFPEAADDLAGIESPLPHLLFDQWEVVTNKGQVEHRNS